MSNLRINTDSAVVAANHISTINNQIRDDFTKVQGAVKQLDAAWDGSASTSAIAKFNELNAKFPQPRYQVVDNFVKFLLQQVGEGYTQTEEVNTSLADAFK